MTDALRDGIHEVAHPKIYTACTVHLIRRKERGKQRGALRLLRDDFPSESEMMFKRKFPRKNGAIIVFFRRKGAEILMIR